MRDGTGCTDVACPECLSDNVEVRDYDFGICRQTGYHDAGERFRCRDCAATGDAADLMRRVAAGCASDREWAIQPTRSQTSRKGPTECERVAAGRDVGTPELIFGT